MNFETFITIVATLGSGSLITLVVGHYLGKGKEVEFKKLEQKERRYRSVFAYMYGYLLPSSRRFIDWDESVVSDNEIIEFLTAQYYDMTLFASKNVLVSTKKFIETPNADNFLSVILNMREDLWIGKNDLDIKETKMEFLSKT